jgi:hypothetical protein
MKRTAKKASIRTELTTQENTSHEIQATGADTPKPARTHAVNVIVTPFTVHKDPQGTTYVTWEYYLA